MIGSYEIADKFISGNVISKAEYVERYLENHPDHEAAKESLAALREATPRPIPFDDLDFTFSLFLLSRKDMNCKSKVRNQ